MPQYHVKLCSIFLLSYIFISIFFYILSNVNIINSLYSLTVTIKIFYYQYIFQVIYTFAFNFVNRFITFENPVCGQQSSLNPQQC